LALADASNAAFAPLGVVSKIKVEKKTRGPGEFCPTCGKELSGRVIGAMGLKFHVECFQCSQCAQPITSESFTVRGTKPWCEKCCKWADGKMLPPDVVDSSFASAPKKEAAKKATTKVPAASSASSAKKPTAIVEEKEQIDTMQGFEPKMCSKCSRMIMMGVDYKDKSFCVGCFTCNSCHLPIEPGMGFLPVGAGDLVMCKDCASSRMGVADSTASSKSGGSQAGRPISGSKACAVCGEGLIGSFIKVDGKEMHVTCFKCDSCSGSLENGYITRGAKKLCGSCGSKKALEGTYESKPLDTPISGIRVDPRTGKKYTVDHSAVAPKPNFCPQCGVKVTAAKFCTECGFKL